VKKYGIAGQVTDDNTIMVQSDRPQMTIQFGA